MGSGCLGIRGGRGVSRSGEINPSAALSGTGFDGVVGGLFDALSAVLLRLPTLRPLTNLSVMKSA